MTKEEAARILDPETREDALAEIEYFGGFKGPEAVRAALDEACRIAAAELRNKPTGEALALEQLRKMDGQPVWVTPAGFWALVIAKRGKRVQLICNDGEKVWADKEIELVGPVYAYQDTIIPGYRERAEKAESQRDEALKGYSAMESKYALEMERRKMAEARCRRLEKETWEASEAALAEQEGGHNGEA